MDSLSCYFMERMQTFIKAVYAGFMIGIGGIVFLSIENKIIASLFFCFGLTTIVIQNLNLYTGRIGFVKTWKEMPDMFIIILGNFAGTYVASTLARAAHLNINSLAMVEKKLDNSLLHIFLLSVFCGVMMYLAIDGYAKTKNIVLIIAPVMIFILSGFEHSIANMFYFNLAGSFQLKTFGYILVMLAGNGIGARVFGIKPYHT